MVADEYDHLCHQADQSKSLTPAEALSRLYDHYIMKNLMTVRDRIDGMMNENVLEPNVAGTPVEGNGTGEHTIQDKAEFSEEIVVSMVRALGVYPPGSLVELTNGSMGLVTGVNSEERTKPCVMVCFPGVPRKEARIIDLTHDDQLSIVQNIRPQHLPQDVHEYFFSNR
jgi:hypothetical protein